jgi:hypothetical protein
MDTAALLVIFKKLMMSVQRWAVVPILGPAGYLLLVALLRFRRLRQTQKEFNYPNRESYAKMTDSDAWKIQTRLAELEFPFTYLKAIQFALFRASTPIPFRLLNPC